MKSIFALCVLSFTFASALAAPSFPVPSFPSFPSFPVPSDLIQEIEKILPNIFNFTDLSLPSLADIASSVSVGKCPEPNELSEKFNLEKFLGTWYEIKRSNLIFEIGQRCVQANYVLDDAGNVAVNNSGVNLLNKPVYNVGTAASTDKSNVFAVKFFILSPSAQYWVVDTDYDNYALVISCNDILGLFNINDAWILSRKSTLDEEIIQKLESKLESLGYSASRLTATVQDC